MDVASCHLDGNADAVEFCPHQPFHHILAAATYTLEEGIQPNRSGSISLFSADADTGLQLLYRFQTAGVFDVKWNTPGSPGHPLLAQADADGCLTLHSLQSSEKATTRGNTYSCYPHVIHHFFFFLLITIYIRYINIQFKLHDIDFNWMQGLF